MVIYKREIFEEIEKYLEEEGVIVLNGARQVGKTYILFYIENYLKNLNKEVFYIDLEDTRFLKILNSGANELIRYIEGEGGFKAQKTFLLIDEIQYLNEPSSFLKIIADHHKNLKLIVSGSSSFEIKNKFKNSLVGRTVSFEIFPLSFKEFLIFKDIHLNLHALTRMKLDELKEIYKEYVLFGGYPKIVLTKEIEKKEKYLQQIIDTYIRKDIRDLANIKGIDKFNRLLEVLASQSGKLLNISELSNTSGIAKKTAEEYIFILENTYILKLLHPYSKNLRSELFKTPKIFFYDTGIMQMLWLKQLPKEIIGNAFETSVFSELAKRYGVEKINYWRTKDKKEIDFILDNSGRITPIEVKLNFGKFNKTAVNYFINKYGLKKYKVIGLLGDLKENFIYPWDVYDEDTAGEAKY